MSESVKKLAAEFIGVFFLVFIGTGAIAVDSSGQASIGLLGVAFAFGLTLAIMVGVTAGVSGGHLNPAVTFGMLLTGNIDGKGAGSYIAAQLLGASAASLLLRNLVWMNPPSAASAGVTLPSAGVSLGSLIGLEIIMTFMLVFVVFAVAVDPNSPFKNIGNLLIGLTVTVCALFGGSLTGASLNPARSFGPALISGEWTLHWAYWLAPLAGGALASLLYSKIFLAGNKS